MTDEIRRDIAARLSDETEEGRQAYLDGLWMGLVVCGSMEHSQFEELEDEIRRLEGLR